MKYADFRLTREDLITCDGFFEFARNHPEVVFVKPDVLLEGQPMSEYKGESPHPKSGVPPKERIWISSHSDHPILDCLVEKYSDHFDHWFAVNADSSDSRVEMLPLGMNLNEATYKALFSSLDIPRSRANLAFLSFNVHTHLAERGAARAILEPNEWVTSKYYLSQEEYYANLRSHPFTICPRGNGYDTHRFWEALYCGSIPVVRETPVIRAFKDKLPMVIIDNWYDLTEEFLEEEYKRILVCNSFDEKLLKQSYWLEKIQAQVECERR